MRRSNLNRRAFLRGASGLLVALPLLEYTQGKVLAAPGQAKRFIVVFSHGGTISWRNRSGELDDDSGKHTSIDLWAPKDPGSVLGTLGDGPLGVTEVAERSGLPKSTAARLLTTLAGEGAVEQIPGDTAYRLGPRLITLAGGFSMARSLAAIARPTPPACVIQTASAAQKPRTSGDSPSSEKPSGVKEKRPLNAEPNVASRSAGMRAAASASDSAKCSGVNSMIAGWSLCGSASARTGSGSCR